MLRHTFRAMGTDIECLLERPRDAMAERVLAEAEAEFARLEATLSRFLPDSELSQLNAAGEATVGSDLLELAEAALEARAPPPADSIRPSTTPWSRRGTTARSSSSRRGRTSRPLTQRFRRILGLRAAAAGYTSIATARASRSTPGHDWTSAASAKGMRPIASAVSSAPPARAS